MPKCDRFRRRQRDAAAIPRDRGSYDEAAGDLDFAPLFEEEEPGEIRPAPNEDCKEALLAIGDDESFEVPTEVANVENFLSIRINSFASS